MGGFEGGDEGGFWDEDAILTLIEKPQKNKEIFYIETNEFGCSIKVPSKGLYVKISLVECECESFVIEGSDDVEIPSDTLYKAYQALLSYTCDTDLEDFINGHKVIVTKNSSCSSTLSANEFDTLSFMRLLKDACNLILSDDDLIKIQSTL